MSEINNLELWDKVSKTDPKYTKYGSVNGMMTTSINPMYVNKLATEVFGSVGKGWGYELKEDRYDQGAPVHADNVLLGHEIMHTCFVEVWYMIGDTKHTVSHYGHTPFVRKTKYGLQTDFEAPKKSLTDAIKKALSILGFTADIFMGEFEDQEYLSHRTAEAEIERADNKEAEAAKKRQEYLDEMSGLMDQLKQSVNMAMLKGIRNSMIRKADLRGHKEIIIKIEKAYADREQELKGGAK